MYTKYFTNVVCFPDADNITEPIREELDKALKIFRHEVEKY